jgi:hypothetical protein
VNQLVSELPAGTTNKVSLDRFAGNYRDKYLGTQFVQFRNNVAAQTDYRPVYNRGLTEPIGSATVDAEALWVRLAYLAQRLQGRTDADAITAVQTSWGDSQKTWRETLYYMCPPYKSTRLLRRAIRAGN